MRSFRGRLARPTTVLRTAGIGGDSSVKARIAVFLAAVVGAILVAGFVLAGDPATVGAKRYSAYADPEKTAISYLLSDPENVADFQQEFSLDDAEMADVLDVVRRENEVLAQTFSKSERIVSANRGEPKYRVADKIAASSFDESVRAAVAETKGEIRRILPPARRSDLRRWVDARWQEEQEEFDENPSSFLTTSTAQRGRAFKVFATQYRGYTRREVALPHKKLKIRGGYKVRIRVVGSSERRWVKVKEVGPWNIEDNWYARKKHRDRFKSLPRGVPEAQAAYFDNFRNGRDQFRRKVLNPAGVDLTPRFAREIGLKKYENAWVYVRVPWVRR